MARRPDAPVLLSAIAGSLLVAASFLSLMAAFEAQPAEGTLSALRSQQQVESADAAAAARASLQAARWFDMGRHLTDAALARSAVVGAVADTPQTETLVRRALGTGPASPHNWTRLANARRLAGDSAGAIRAWEMSVLTGRYVPGLMIPRLDAGFRLLPAADRSQVELLGDQVRLVASLDADGLARLAAQRRVEPFVRAALVAAPDLLVAYETAERGVRRG